MPFESSSGKVSDLSDFCTGIWFLPLKVARDQALKSRSGKQKLQILPALGKLLILAARYDEKDEEGKFEPVSRGWKVLTENWSATLSCEFRWSAAL